MSTDRASGVAPVALVAFNRPEHTRRTLDALARNPEAADTTLYAFIDGPRNENEAERVRAVLRLVESATGFREVRVHARPANLGLFASVTGAVSEVLSRHEAVIVVEDDIVCGPDFLAYMNDALRKYRDAARVGSIHAYAVPARGLPDYFFLGGGDCWGWATWSDRWRMFEPDAGGLVARLYASGRVREFCRVQGYRSLLMLVQRALGRNGSWALPWHASLFLQDRLTLHPGASFVENIGNDGSGEHSAASAIFETGLRARYEGLPDIAVAQDPDAARSVSRYYDSAGRTGLLARVERGLLALYAMALGWRVAKRSRVAAGGHRDD